MLVLFYKNLNILKKYFFQLIFRIYLYSILLIYVCKFYVFNQNLSNKTNPSCLEIDKLIRLSSKVKIINFDSKGKLVLLKRE